ncbi:hypothetical protein ACOTWV_08905 [Aliarcobacter butzleri]
MSSDKSSKPTQPTVRPTVGKIYENSKNIPRPTPSKPTNPPPTKKGK